MLAFRRKRTYTVIDSDALQRIQMKKQLPVGTSDYKKLRDNNFYFVDKTLLIKDIAESGEVVLVPRPRRFGKTLNLSMLRYFYEISSTRTDSLFPIRISGSFLSIGHAKGHFRSFFFHFEKLSRIHFQR